MSDNRATAGLPTDDVDQQLKVFEELSPVRDLCVALKRLHANGTYYDGEMPTIPLAAQTAAGSLINSARYVQVDSDEAARRWEWFEIIARALGSVSKAARWCSAECTNLVLPPED